MKIESLYEYIVLAHYLNFTTAASNLHTSQPNLSKHISELEQELGVTLLRREKRLELTAAGTAFLEDAIQIHHLYKDATKRCREIDAYAVEELVIQEPYLMDAMSEILFKSVMRFRRSDPHVMTKYYSEKGKKSVELLEAGKVDIALTVDCNSIDWITKVSEKKNLIFFPVIREPLHVWLWERHPLASKQSITLEDLLAGSHQHDRNAQLRPYALRRAGPVRHDAGNAPQFADVFERHAERILHEHPRPQRRVPGVASRGLLSPAADAARHGGPTAG